MSFDKESEDKSYIIQKESPTIGDPWKASWESDMGDTKPLLLSYSKGPKISYAKELVRRHPLENQ